MFSWAQEKEKVKQCEMVINILSKEDVREDTNRTIKSFIKNHSYHSSSTNSRSSGSTKMEANKIRLVSQNDVVYDFTKHLKLEMNMYAPMVDSAKKHVDGTKTYFEDQNPDLCLLFGPDGINMGGFPGLMKEFSEIIH